MVRLIAAALLWLIPVAAQAAFEDKPLATLRWLNKITAQTESMDVPIGETVHYGDLAVRVRSCRKQDPLEGADSAAFLQVWEKDEDDEPRWVFSGWMFASSPGLSAMDHPIYDVWPLDCTDSLEKLAEQKQAQEQEQDAKEDLGEQASEETAEEEESEEVSEESSEESSETSIDAESETEAP